MRDCVYCKRNNAASRDVSLHQFPKDEAILSVWLQNMGFDAKWRPLRSQYLCSKHFSSKWLVGKRLKKGSIPTIFENYIENNVTYEKFKIKNEEIDIDDEFAMKEFNINSNPDIKSVETKGNHEIIKVEKEEVDLNDEYEVNGENKIKRDWDIKSREVNGSYLVKIKEEGDKNDKFDIIGEYNIMIDWNIKSGEECEIYEVITKEVDVKVKVENISDEEVREPNENKRRAPASATSERPSDANRIDGVRKNIKSSKVICDICNTRYANKRNLSEHIVSKHTPHPRPTRTTSALSLCPYCNKSYRTKYLSNHINAVHTKTTTYKCPHCKYTAYYQNTVLEHVNAKHTQSKMFDCTFCEYKSYRKFHLDRHLNAHHTKNSSYICSYCNHKAYCRYTLEKHINAKHTKSVSFSCPHCTFQSYQKENLKRHVNAKHTKSTYFICAYCNYKTFVKNDLCKHINSLHTKSVRYDCSCCSFKTFEAIRLKSHMAAKHNKCINNTFLRQHINSEHAKIIAFNCNSCNYTSSSKYRFDRHIKTHHL